jgi:uncharacterized SAM-binding protein YcdF (DUF218 family)
MYQFVVDLLSHFTLLLLLLLAAVLNLWRRRVETRRRLLLVSLPLALLLFLCTPLAAYWAASLLEWPYPPISQVPPEAEAIVVLGGGIREATSTLPHAELAEDTRMRCIYAAVLYSERPLPVLVTGGIVEPELDVPPLAEEMKKLLVSLGVPAAEIFVEDRSRSTYENAAFSQPLLAERNVEQIVLVTDAGHMSRAARCFAAQGFDVAPAACRHASETFRFGPRSLLPRAAAARSVREAMHEWLGIVWYEVSGKT